MSVRELKTPEELLEGGRLELLEELAREQQVLLFTCQRREGAALEGTSAVTRLEL